MDSNRHESDREGGYALLVSLVALVVLSGLAAGGIWVANADFRSSEAFSNGRRAFYVADAALQQYVGTQGVNPPPTWQPGSDVLASDEDATVTAVQMQQDPRLYRIEATGTVDVNGETVARRTVGVVAELDLSDLPEPTSAMLALNGLHLNGGPSVTLDGKDMYDEKSTASCPASVPYGDDKNGVEVPTGLYSQSGGGDDGGGDSGEGCEYTPDGNPHCVLEENYDDMAEDLDIDWESVRTGEAFEPDYVISQDGDGWDDIPESSDWPVILVEDGEDNDEQSTFTIPKDEPDQGLLIVPGDVRMNGNTTWRGLIYAGGKFTGNGNNTLYGSMLTGLNHLDDGGPGDQSTIQSTIGNGTKHFQYHSCYVWKARSAMARLRPVAGSWYQGDGQG